ncbi:protein sister of odd and bowel-like [Lethenteron reissneri]|uniref:protein sister of odd and bowel-like n=1 Tax=Lethenteron reissneri TaxID=7753 RepID=UPI002AB67B12|nr:protein sister of odd and bowel-like [Lethenteron reissneri]
MEEHAMSLLAQLRAQRARGDLCDCMFEISGGTTFPAHRAVLAAFSPHLAALCCGVSDSLPSRIIELHTPPNGGGQTPKEDTFPSGSNIADTYTHGNCRVIMAQESATSTGDSRFDNGAANGMEDTAGMSGQRRAMATKTGSQSGSGIAVVTLNNNIISPCAIAAVLDFIYSGQVRLNGCSAEELKSAALHMQVEALTTLLRTQGMDGQIPTCKQNVPSPSHPEAAATTVTSSNGAWVPVASALSSSRRRGFAVPSRPRSDALEELLLRQSAEQGLSPVAASAEDAASKAVTPVSSLSPCHSSPPLSSDELEDEQHSDTPAQSTGETGRLVENSFKEFEHDGIRNSNGSVTDVVKGAMVNDSAPAPLTCHVGDVQSVAAVDERESKQTSEAECRSVDGAGDTTLSDGGNSSASGQREARKNQRKQRLPVKQTDLCWSSPGQRPSFRRRNRANVANRRRRAQRLETTTSELWPGNGAEAERDVSSVSDRSSDGSSEGRYERPRCAKSGGKRGPTVASDRKAARKKIRRVAAPKVAVSAAAVERSVPAGEAAGRCCTNSTPASARAPTGHVGEKESWMDAGFPTQPSDAEHATSEMTGSSCASNGKAPEQIPPGASEEASEEASKEAGRHENAPGGWPDTWTPTGLERDDGGNDPASVRLSRRKPICQTCGKEFSEPSSLRRHARIHKGLRPFVCSLCDKAFTQGNQLKTHMRIHTGEKPYVCEVCGKAFAQKCQLVFHTRMHHGDEKPYGCDVCGLRFATSSNLKIHVSRKHSGEKPYMCDTCGQRFAQASTLTYHVRRHTGERPYVCNVCGRTFAVSSSLITHARKHTGEKPYICNTCGKCFCSSGELKKHSRSHTGERPFICEICGNLYTDAKNLRKHLNRVHLGENFSNKKTDMEDSSTSYLKTEPKSEADILPIEQLVAMTTSHLPTEVIVTDGGGGGQASVTITTGEANAHLVYLASQLYCDQA